MGFEPLVWYCQPVEGGIWATVTDSAFGAYTPCGIDSVVVCISHLVLLGLCFYRIWLIRNDLKVQRYQLRSKYYNYVLGLLAGYCIAEPLFRLVMGISLFNLEGQTGLAPFEMVSLIIVALAWCSMLAMLGIETGIYIREFRWYVRFGAAYGGCSMLNLILHRVLFGVFLFVYIPQLDPYPGYVPIRNDPLIDTKYEALIGGEHVCPERDASIFSNPLLLLSKNPRSEFREVCGAMRLGVSGVEMAATQWPLGLAWQ
ncbi:hypothetical protein TEA_007950 [Camellia sinensis var. sinensis]|uniref:Uncharacterized protein n=1 Tax=Camellia sinensis var. sinensis TaxID=542762 RepID=A0A4S4EYM1_CAMSN|nr:hypothetical protein TEA_007950 [Camellia sinensis var. sinensis]